MANKSVLELAVETGKWDAGLKKGKEALDKFTQAQGGLQQALEKDNGDMAEFIKMMGNMDSTAKTAKQQLREISNVLTDFTATYRQLTDEQKASPFGQELAKSIQTLTERAGVLRDAMDDVQQSIRNAASDTRIFDQMAQGASVVTAGFQGLTGAGKLLGIEMGNDVQVIAKLQAAMAVTNSLTTIQTALQKESALMMGVAAVQTKAAAVAPALLAKETIAATVAGKAFNIVAKANPIGLVLTTVAAAATAFGLFSSSEDTATDSSERFNNSLDKMDGKLKDLETSFQNLISYMQQIGSSSDVIDDLRKQAADEEVRLAREEYMKLFNSGLSGTAGRIMTSINQNIIPKEVQQQALDKLTAARERQGKVYAEIENKIKAGQYFDTNWSTLKSEKEINAAINYFKNLRAEVDQGTDAWDKYNKRITDLQAKLPKTNTTKKGGSTSTTTKELTETQKLQKNIEALTKEYQQLSDVEKVADFNMAAGIELRKTAIRGEIKTNQQRIDELKKFADEAQGKNITVKVDVEPTVNGSSFTQESISKYVQELQKQLSSLDMSMGGSSAMANDLYANIIDAQTFGNLLKTSIQHGIDLAAVGIDTTSLWEQITNGDGLEDADWKGFVEKINEQLKKQGIKLSIDPQTGNISTDKKEKNTTSKALEKFNGDFSKLTGGVSSIVSGVQSMGVEIPKSIQSVMGVLTGISSIMSGIASILTVIEATTTIAAAKPLAMGGVIHAAGGWSGFVPGNSFSGDNVPALLNSGELVLNKFQQQALAGTLENGGLKNITISGALRGEDIVLSADRWGRRTGKGELLFAKNL